MVNLINTCLLVENFLLYRTTVLPGTMGRNIYVTFFKHPHYHCKMFFLWIYDQFKSKQALLLTRYEKYRKIIIKRSYSNPLINFQIRKPIDKNYPPKMMLICSFIFPSVFPFLYDIFF